VVIELVDVAHPPPRPTTHTVADDHHAESRVLRTAQHRRSGASPDGSLAGDGGRRASRNCAQLNLDVGLAQLRCNSRDGGEHPTHAQHVG
ncbi:MAG TPA: hypothetical protein VFC48_02375, partial [Cellulomonas sp.]|nr:hypothetical protein [Cellulomonas sp.]